MSGLSGGVGGGGGVVYVKVAMLGFGLQVQERETHLDLAWERSFSAL